MRARSRTLDVHYDAPGVEQFRDDVLRGLAVGPGHPKSIPYKYLYDERGSELFESICEVKEYYLTRTELAIMSSHASEMAEALGPRLLLIEYGSGSGIKTRMLLDHLEAPVGYVPIDISSEALVESAARLNEAYPSLEVLPVNADYTAPIELPRPTRPADHRAVYFPGSTIGNFLPDEALDFLKRVVRIVGERGGLLIGVDLKKDPAILEAAYDDAGGVTEAFTKNLLVRINRELGGDFAPDRFRHRARYAEREGRVEIHLVSRIDQLVRISGVSIPFAADEPIHIENSYKYDLEGFALLAATAGLEVKRVWTDPRRLFSVQHLTVT